MQRGVSIWGCRRIISLSLYVQLCKKFYFLFLSLNVMSVLNLPFLLKMTGTSSQLTHGFSLGSEEVPGSWCGLEMAGLNGRRLSIYVDLQEHISVYLREPLPDPQSLKHVWIAPRCWVPWPMYCPQHPGTPETPWGCLGPVLTHCTDKPSALVSYWLRDFQESSYPQQWGSDPLCSWFPILSRGPIIQLHQLPCSRDSVQGKRPTEYLRPSRAVQ